MRKRNKICHMRGMSDTDIENNLPIFRQNLEMKTCL